MRDITKNKHYFINYNLEKKVEEVSSIVLNDGDTINFPAVLPFDEEHYNKTLNYIKMLIEKGKIKCENNGNFNIAFDFWEIKITYYRNWDGILNFAQKNNIQFRINEKIEYTPEEMRNYIDKFIDIDEEKQKEFIFRGIKYDLDDNPLYDSKNDTEIIDDEENFCLYLDSQISNTIINHLHSFTTRKIILSVKEGIFDNKCLKYAKEAIDTINDISPNKYINIYFGSKYEYYTKQEFENLLKFEQYVKETYNKNYELQFHSGFNSVNKTQILNANSKISAVVDYLKKSKLSPYEKIIYVHKLVTEKSYYTDRGVDQDLYASLNSRGIVCITYCSIFKAIFDELDDPNIKTEIQLYNYANEKGTLHSANIVYLKDKKYNIEGYYDLDITINQGQNSLNQFMIPAGDIMYNAFHKTTKKVPFDASPLLKRVAYFIKRDLSNLDAIDSRIDEITKRNTYKFLNTPLGTKAILFSKNFYSAINKCIDKTTIIPLEKTKKAIEVVTEYCYGFDKDDRTSYSKNLLFMTIFDSIYFCDREKCKNDIAKKSLELEKTITCQANKISNKKRS